MTRCYFLPETCEHDIIDDLLYEYFRCKVESNFSQLHICITNLNYAVDQFLVVFLKFWITSSCFWWFCVQVMNIKGWLLIEESIVLIRRRMDILVHVCVCVWERNSCNFKSVNKLFFFYYYYHFSYNITNKLYNIIAVTFSHGLALV